MVIIYRFRILIVLSLGVFQDPSLVLRLNLRHCIYFVKITLCRALVLKITFALESEFRPAKIFLIGYFESYFHSSFNSPALS